MKKNNMKIASVDIGLSGGISVDGKAQSMPIKLIEIKPAVMVLSKDKSGKKQYYKSGPLKGQPKHKIKTPAKYAKELNIPEIHSIFSGCDVVVFESPGTSAGNSAKSSRTTHTNYGKLLACAELANCKIHTVAPNKWKKDLELPADKLPTIELAESLSSESFRTERGALLDGQADAYCIGYWYRKFILKEDI